MFFIIKKLFKSDELKTGYLYFYIHFVVEVACFYYLSRVTDGSMIVWLIPLIYDAFAFVPQGIFGYISDKFPKLKLDLIGIAFLFLAYIILIFTSLNVFYSLFILCLGNCMLHISGAEATLKTSNGKLSPSAIFVSGGSFGVVTGRLLYRFRLSIFIILPLILTMIPFALLAKEYENENKDKELKHNYVKENINPILILFVAIFIVTIRGYVGYGIPTSWNKSIIQNVMLFSFMGIGKALGGILSDTIGIRKVGILSTLVAIPFLSFGDNIMVVSLVGVMFFSMTMAITLGMLASIFKKNPGLAFGYTTIGLFLGTAPIFFIRVIGLANNIILIAISSIICSLLLSLTLKKEVK
ncbi:MAG: hypothetical protein IKX00_02135 [Bacilli bacterium]|nr:hypothetical protein [Bacilli bacterium]